MKKSKLKIDQLKIRSFVTSLDTQEVRAGAPSVKDEGSDGLGPCAYITFACFPESLQAQANCNQ